MGRESSLRFRFSIWVDTPNFTYRLVEKHGIAVFTKSIEDRLFYLRTNQVLAESIARSLTGKPTDANMADRKHELGAMNEQKIIPILDFIRRRPQLDLLQTYKPCQKKI